MDRTPPRFEDFPSKVRAIIVEETERAGVGVKDVLSFSRRKLISHTRFAIWARERYELTQANGSPMSFPKIGRRWRRDHTTIIHGVERYFGGLEG